MKILSAKQISAADQYTIEKEAIASVDLMERAATICFKWIVQHFDSSHKFKVFCGTGNNGGDGLAIARMLHSNGYQVAVYSVRFSKNTSEDFRTNETRLHHLDKANIFEVTTTKEIPRISKDDVIIDALLGTGLNKPVKHLPAEVIKGRDPQLERAVQEALKLLEQSPVRRVPRPAPINRVSKDREK